MLAHRMGILAFAAWGMSCREPHADPPAATRELRFVALGDSFTIGTGSTPEASFPARLRSRWQAMGCAAALRNLAVNGYTSHDVATRELPELGAPAPDFVTFAVGANDIVRGTSE